MLHWIMSFILLSYGLLTLVAQTQNANVAERTISLADLQPSENELFVQAIEQQRQKKYALAIQYFTDLLRFYPQSASTEEILHRVAECYRALGRFDDARETLKLNREKFPHGKCLEAGWLLEGEMLAADRKWEGAVSALEHVSGSQNFVLRTRALYVMILCRENMGLLSQARPLIEKLQGISDENPYLDFARLKLGTLESESNPDHALSLFKSVLSHTSDAALRAEAGVRAGNLTYARENCKKAIGFFETVRHTDSPDFWKKLAHLGLIQSNFAMKDYDAVIRIFNEVRPQFPDAARAQVFFLVAESYRLQKKIKEAIDQYDFILREFPNNSVAEPSAWARLLLLQGFQKFIDETAAFLARFPKSERAPLVKLMRADVFFEKEQFSICAPMYAELSKDKTIQALDVSVLNGMNFRWGQSAFAVKDYETAAMLLKEFAEKNPKHELTPNALWFLAQSEQALHDVPAAREALRELLEFSNFPQRETALWQAGMLAVGQKDCAAAVKLLLQLVESFPQTKWMGDAHYWWAFCLVEQKKDDEAISHWEKARAFNADAYTEQASLQLIRIFLEKKRLDDLINEVRRYDAWRAKHPKSPPIATDVIEWVAQELARSSTSAKAESYYRRTLVETKNAQQRQRAQLGLAMLLSKLKNYGGAIEEWQSYRANYPADAQKSAVLEPLAQAYIGAAEFDKANKLAEQILTQNPEGEYNARGRMLLGDIAFAQRNYTEAAKIYSAVALLIDHPVITPLAKSRAEEARKLAGKPKN